MREKNRERGELKSKLWDDEKEKKGFREREREREREKERERGGRAEYLD